MSHSTFIIILGPSLFCLNSFRLGLTFELKFWYAKQLYTGDSIHTGVVFVILYFFLSPMIYVAEMHTLRERPMSARRRHTSALRMALGLLSCTMISILIIELGKGYVGRLRPSFARVCLTPANPPYNPSTTSAATIRTMYMSDAECPTPDRHSLHDARRSFPSGHASLAVSGAMYGQLVLTRLAREGIENEIVALGVYAVGWLWMTFAAWVSASRVFDNAHHVGDVAVGSVVGVCAGAVHFWYVLGRNEVAQRREHEKETDKTQ